MPVKLNHGSIMFSKYFLYIRAVLEACFFVGCQERIGLLLSFRHALIKGFRH